MVDGRHVPCNFNQSGFSTPKISSRSDHLHPRRRKINQITICQHLRYTLHVSFTFIGIYIIIHQFIQRRSKITTSSLPKMPTIADDFIHHQPSASTSLLHSTTPHSRRQTYGRLRHKAQAQLSTKKKHYMVMALVALDVGGILADIFVALIACDRHEQEEPWVGDVRDGLRVASLVFSCLFLVELGVCVWAFGVRYFSSWFHCFDAVVILVSFVSDLLTQGIVEEIASLVIVLRLWRFVKIVEELSVGASETMEDTQARLEEVEKENEVLRSEIRALRGREEV
ncbi:hypothetical protein GE09DRAFT_1122491 [Coniochaeta sp. 2T2.1]|nr:hypothetical protein GE09DRAFT_1122491 [Coniochaeta sp. 2T2.1]